MQNKPNFQDAQMNLKFCKKMAYEILIPLAGQKNKPNSNPNKPNLRKAKMNVKSLIAKDYRKNDAFASQENKPNSNPIPEEPKMNVSSIVTIDYENISDWTLSENKPNQTQFPLPSLPCPQSSLLAHKKAEKYEKIVRNA